MPASTLNPPKVLEFFFGGVSTCGAALFTNPLEVVKTRMQLQGELKARGQFQVHYRNVFHAFFTIARYEGASGLQKGLIPALAYQFVMNGIRLGSFQLLSDSQLFQVLMEIYCGESARQDENGNMPVIGSIACGALAGTLGGFCGSPIYMMKTQLQARANSSIAVGYQNKVTGFMSGLAYVYRTFGVIGLWRGSAGAVVRVMIGSATQLSTFSQSKAYIISTNLFSPNSLWVPFLASTLSGCVVVACMTPFDVISTRLYNQKTHGATSKGGVLYSGVVDCFRKIFVKEGLWGFYKGWAASLFRLGPHTVLSLLFWDQTRELYLKWSRHQQGDS